MLRNIPCTKLFSSLFLTPKSDVDDKSNLMHLSLPANLDEYPEKFDSINKKHFTIGDLHGNSLKMLYFLIKTNILDITAEDYYKLRDAYHQVEKGDMKAIFNFEKIIHKYFLLQKNVQLDIKIRFLGDLLADRGANDYLTFLVLSLLRNTKYEIVFSNHDLEYMTHSECDMLNNDMNCYIDPMFLNSLMQLKNFLNSQKLITPKYIHSLEQLYYKSHLKLLSYTVPKNQESIHIYSHALIDLHTIENIAKKFLVDASHIKESRANLCQVVDAINERFQKWVRVRNVHRLFDLGRSNAGCGDVSYEYPVEQAVWNRKLIESEVEKHNSASYIIEFYHGHTEKMLLPHYHGYDNHFGKGVRNDVGTLDVYHSDNPSSSDFKAKPIC